MTRPRTTAKPVPTDFAERALAGTSVSDLRKHYRVGSWVINRWTASIGGKPRAKRVLPPQPVPADFSVNAQRETVDLLMKRYQVGTEKIARWRRECGLSVVRAIPIPEGFADAAPTLTVAQMEERYGVTRVTINKWCLQFGVKPAPGVRGPAGVPSLGAMGRAKPAPLNQHRDTSRAGQAADYLRQYGPVIRCNPAGHYDPKGNHWRRGSTVLCADEVIARAIRNGWNPDAWKALAA